MRLVCVEGKGRRGVFLVTQKMRVSGVCMFWGKGEGGKERRKGVARFLCERKSVCVNMCMCVRACVCGWVGGCVCACVVSVEIHVCVYANTHTQGATPGLLARCNCLVFL